MKERKKKNESVRMTDSQSEKQKRRRRERGRKIESETEREGWQVTGQLANQEAKAAKLANQTTREAAKLADGSVRGKKEQSAGLFMEQASWRICQLIIRKRQTE